MEGMCRFFTAGRDAREVLETLSPRQRRLALGAVEYHSLLNPGRTLCYRVYVGERWQYPHLTDVTTLDGSLTERAGLKPLGEFEATSTVVARSPFPPHCLPDGTPAPDGPVRHLLLSPDDATDADVDRHHPRDRAVVRLYRRCGTMAPLAFDYVREAFRRRCERRNARPIPPAVSPFERSDGSIHDVPADDSAPASAHGTTAPTSVPALSLAPDTAPTPAAPALACGPDGHPWPQVRPGEPAPDAPRAVLIAMYWLQSGGAERWGLETVSLARQAGLLPIVLTDRDGHQPWICDPALDGALVMPLTQPLQERPGDVPILRALFEQFDVRGVVVHHCQWMYDRAWWVRRFFPRTLVVDSLHIVEYVMRGGYPRQAVAHDRWIDLHHVISPQLERWMTDVHGVDPAKTVLAPLVGLTAGGAAPEARPRSDGGRLTVAFVGRITDQKRPEAFLLTARRLLRERPGAFRFLLHGSGDRDGYVDALIGRYGLGDAVERRSADVPVSRTYAEADVLLVSSENEGLTLTTLEAIAAGVPVLSADVGSQGTLVPPQGLLRRMTASFVHDAARSLTHVLDDEDDRRRLWRTERDRLVAFSKLRSADDLFRDLFRRWAG